MPYCGGTIIGRFSILTAAHCVEYMIVSSIYARMGSKNLTVGGYTRTFRKAVVHVDYNSLTQENDIALLFLKYPLFFTNKVSPIKLPPAGQDLANGEIVHVTVWDSQNIGNETEWPDPANNIHILNVASIPIVDQDNCTRVYNEMDYTITDYMFCAGDGNVGGISCQVRPVIL